jgi:hypothetical protein
MVPSRATCTGSAASARRRLVASAQSLQRWFISAYSSAVEGSVTHRRNSFMAPMTTGWAEKVPTT